MAESSSRRSDVRQNLELFSVLWLDPSASKPSTLEQLKSVIDYLVTFENESSCLRYIHHQPKDARILLITSGRHGRVIVPQLTDVSQVIAIYIFCMDVKANREWSKAYPKVKDVLVRLPDLVNRVRDEYALQQQGYFDQPLLFRYFQPKADPSGDPTRIKENDNFLQDQLLIDCLIRMGSSPTKKRALTTFCEHYYQKNPFELLNIEKFSREYSPQSSLGWYRKSDFTYRMLNKALYTSHVDLLILLQFFIHDLGSELANRRRASEVRVYRHHWMTTAELQWLEKSIDNFVSINTFLSTTYDRKLTDGLLQTTQLNRKMEKVSLKIDADPNLVGTRPFGEAVQDQRSSPPKQILFMVGSIFRVKSVKQSDDRIWHVHLVLASIYDKHLKPVPAQLKKRLDKGPLNYLQFGYLLNEMKLFGPAEKAFRRHLNQLPPDHPELVDCYRAFGFIARFNKDYHTSLKWYEACLHRLARLEPTDDLKLAETYQDIAHMYKDKGDYSNARRMYGQALESTRSSLGDQHPLVIICLTNLGDLYRTEKNYQEAERHYKEALEVVEKAKMSDLSQRALILRAIARTKEAMNDFDGATRYLKRAAREIQSDAHSNRSLLRQIDEDLGRISDRRK